MRTTIFRVLVILIVCRTPVRAQVGSTDLVAQAKKEGRVTWYTTVSIPESKQFADMFEKRYPFIKVDLLRSGSGALVNRIVSEADPPRLMRGFKKVVQDIDNENMSESIKLFQQTFGLVAG